MIAAPDGGNSKHPVLASNAAGKTLFAWTEGTGWAKGGSLAWKVYNPDGSSTGERGTAEGVPAWSLLSAVARPDGTFLLIY